MFKIIQILNKILKDRSIEVLIKHNLDASYFVGFENEYKFITEHVKQYGNVPDIPTFIAQFPEFTIVDVTETDQFLVDQLVEEKCCADMVGIITKAKQTLETDSIKAYNELTKDLVDIRPQMSIECVDIMATAEQRYTEYLDRENAIASGKVISTGMPELDEILVGWEPGEELVTVLARTNQGKSWLGIKFASAAWEQGKTVLLYSGEMGLSMVGYRVDTTISHISNKSLTRGNKDCLEQYAAHIAKVGKAGNPFFVVTQEELKGKLTIGRLRTLVELYKPDIIIIDQYSLMDDDRAKAGDQPRTKLSHISEDLFLVSTEYKVPIIALAQANRMGIKEDDDSPPGLENIKESDDIAHNSSRVISIRRSADGDLIMEVVKNRTGRVGDRLYLHWDIDTGEYKYLKTVAAGSVVIAPDGGNDNKANYKKRDRQQGEAKKQQYASSEVPF